MQRDGQARFGVIKVIAWIYLALGSALVASSLLHAHVAGQQLEPLSAIGPGLLALGAVGTLLRKQWGRYLSAFFSVIFLVAVPIGTLLGGFMLYQLAHNGSLFRRATVAR